MNLNYEEQIVYNLIKDAQRITQQEIAKSNNWLGYHSKHESHLFINPNETTLRKVRQIIRNLRIKRGIPILSDKYGYWIPKHNSEAIEYLNRIEKMAKAQAKAWNETYMAMKSNFNVSSNYFDKQLQLFEK